MLFAIPINHQGRAILDDDLHGDVIAVIEAKSWIVARQEALGCEAMDAYDYRAGYGWLKRLV